MSAGPVTTATVSQADYAAQRGVSRQAINKLVKRGVIPLVDGRIDPQVADLKLVTHLNPARSKALAPDAPASLSPAASVGAATAARAAAPVSEPAGLSLGSYHGAKAQREIYEALRSKLEYERAAGDVVDRAGVIRAATTAGRATRDAVMPLASRLGPVLAGIDDPREATLLLERELRKALEDAAKLMRSAVERLAVS